MTHTPTPWKIYSGIHHSNTPWRKGRTVCALTDDRQSDIAVAMCDYQTSEIAEANAALIVRAVNAHDDLVKALREARSLIVDDLIMIMEDALPKEKAVVANIDATLSRLGGGDSGQATQSLEAVTRERDELVKVVREARETIRTLTTMAPGIAADLASAHMARANAASDWMRQEDREQRGEFDGLVAKARLEATSIDSLLKQIGNGDGG